MPESGDRWLINLGFNAGWDARVAFVAAGPLDPGPAPSGDDLFTWAEPTDLIARVHAGEGLWFARIPLEDGSWGWVSDGGVSVTWDELRADHPDLRVVTP